MGAPSHAKTSSLESMRSPSGEPSDFTLQAVAARP